MLYDTYHTRMYCYSEFRQPIIKYNQKCSILGIDILYTGLETYDYLIIFLE